MPAVRWREPVVLPGADDEGLSDPELIGDPSHRPLIRAQVVLVQPRTDLVGCVGERVGDLAVRCKPVVVLGPAACGADVAAVPLGDVAEGPASHGQTVSKVRST